MGVLQRTQFDDLLDDGNHLDLRIYPSNNGFKLSKVKAIISALCQQTSTHIECATKTYQSMAIHEMLNDAKIA